MASREYVMHRLAEIDRLEKEELDYHFGGSEATDRIHEAVAAIPTRMANLQTLARTSKSGAVQMKSLRLKRL